MMDSSAMSASHSDVINCCFKNVFSTTRSLALRSGITVASEVHPRRGYC